MANRGRRERSDAASNQAAPRPESRSTHIVLFKGVSEQNRPALAKALGLKEEPVPSGRAGVTVLRSAGGNGKQAKLYGRLAAAAVKADPTSIKRLEADPCVKMVVPNRIRAIPRPLPDVAEKPVPAEMQALEAYLLGMRDAINLTLQFGFGQTPPEVSALRMPGMPPASGRTFMTDSDFSWCLKQVGLRPDYQYTGAGVTVAVLDTGIDLAHADFAGRVIDGDTAISLIDGVASAQDGHGHGTHCAGVVAGPKQSYGGRRYGVAPEVELLVGKVLNDAGSGYDEDIVEGITWAAERGARIISLSLGSEREPNSPYSRLYEQVAEQLFKQSENSVLLIAAAGNESMRPSYTRPVGNPAACPSIMGVAANDKNLGIAYFSCCEMDPVGKVDVSAPGVGVWSSWTGGGFKAISGTSMATPHVAGVAALFLQDDPSLSAKQLWQKLVQSAKNVGSSIDFGAGLVQVP